MIRGVYLVGAGPGDPDLITVKGAKVLALANVIVYDHLANPLLLKYASETCKLIYVGKEAGKHTLQQDKINELLVELSHEHPVVVRLKGGDPYVFGRGSEEGEVLRRAGVAFEVVPGITSAIGGLAYAGIPITARNIATSFHVITGHVSKTSNDIQFEPLAKLDGTLVFLMGVGNLVTIVSELLAHGKDGATPVAIIYKASTPHQKVTVGSLSTIVDLAQKANIKPPSLIVIGDVVNHREHLSFFEERPLFGQHVLVTRAKSNTSKMAEGLRDLGAQVSQMPTIQIIPQNANELDSQLNKLETFNGIIFTSGVAVSLFFERLDNCGLDVRHLHGLQLYAVGNETRKVLASYGLKDIHIPDEFTKEGVSRCIDSKGQVGDRFLVPRSAKGDKDWYEALNQRYSLREVKCYDTVSVKEVAIDISKLEGVDYITFTSASTVQGYVDQLESDTSGKLQEILSQSKVVAIGPTTRQALEANNIRVDLQPDRYTIQSMIDTIQTDVQD